MPRRKCERQAVKLLIDESFSSIATAPFVINKWISIKAWCKLIIQQVDASFSGQISESYFRRVIINSDKVSSNLSIPSNHSYYHRSCKFRKKGENTQKVHHAIYVTEPGQLPQLSPLAFWCDNIITDIPPSWSTHSHVKYVTPPPLLPSQKRQKRNDAAPALASVPIATPAPLPVATPVSLPIASQASIPIATPASIPNNPPASVPVASQTSVPSAIIPEVTTYWTSPEARKFFGYYRPKCKEDCEIPVIDIIYNRIILFRKGALTSSGWRDVLDDRDIDNVCTAPFIMQIQKKCRYLCSALSILYKDRKLIGKHFTWEKCCEIAIQNIKEIENANLMRVILKMMRWLIIIKQTFGFPAVL